MKRLGGYVLSRGESRQNSCKTKWFPELRACTGSVENMQLDISFVGRIYGDLGTEGEEKRKIEIEIFE